MVASRERIAHLDGVRGIAILTVVFVHWVGLRVPAFEGGYIGVDIFFVLSGFIITTLLVERRPTYSEFIRGRVRRLYPPLMGFLAGGCVLAALWPGSAISGADAVRHAAVAATQLSSPWIAAAVSTLEPFGHTWSLSIEWYFYLAWPFVVIILREADPRRVVPPLLVVAVAMYLATVLSSRWFYYGPTARFSELVVGTAVAFWLMQARPVNARLITAVAGLGLIFVAVWTAIGTQHDTAGYRFLAFPVVAATAAALILTGYTRDRNVITRLLTWRPLTTLGLVSYSLYLWHFLPIRLMHGEWLGQPGPVIAAVWGGMVVITTGGAYWLLERPFVRSRPKALASVGPG